MKYYKELTREVLIKYAKVPDIGNRKQGRRNARYLRDVGAFDIETSSIGKNGDKRAFMYLWAFTLTGLENVYFGRTWAEFGELVELLTDVLRLSPKRRLVVYVHNLSYEFQFMRMYFKWSDVMSVDERKPFQALTSVGIEFRDSYILSGFSLAQTAKQLPNSDIEKQIGDLDYSLTRHHLTELSEKELHYAEIDVKIVIEYIESQIDMYGDITNIPLTNTGRVRDHVREYCYYNKPQDKKKSSGEMRKRQKELMSRLIVTPDDYISLKNAFAGGFAHANENYAGQVLENVHSIDFSSSYPAVMIAEEFPMSSSRDITISSLNELRELSIDYCLVFDMRLTGVRPKITQEYYFSESRCDGLINPIIYNGRIKQADVLETTTTSVDFEIIEQVYTWETIQLNNVKLYEKDYLPSRLLEVLLAMYGDKTMLKDVVGKESEYVLSKGMFNSIYGMSVTDIVRTKKTYDEVSWEEQYESMERQVERYNSQENRFLYYPWGVFITAYARKNLWTGIIAMGADYVYSDTDSIKFLNYDKHLPYITNYNEQLIEKLEESCKWNRLDVNLLAPKTQDGVEKMLGVWDYEGLYDKFKVLRAKQYLSQQNDKLELTVAGLSKSKGLCYLIERAGGDLDQVFNLFHEEMYIPAEESGNMTHTYIDFPDTFSVTDYRGVTTEVETLTGLHLEPSDFTLSASLNLTNRIKNEQNGNLSIGG